MESHIQDIYIIKTTMFELYEYKANVISVYDGDTITAEVDLGFKINFTEKFRLARSKSILKLIKIKRVNMVDT